MESGITDLPWVPHSPEMNVIENCWGAIFAAVYDGGRQFEPVEDLKECMIYEWEKLTLNYIHTFISSMPRCVYEL